MKANAEHQDQVPAEDEAGAKVLSKELLIAIALVVAAVLLLTVFR